MEAVFAETTNFFFSLSVVVMVLLMDLNVLLMPHVLTSSTRENAKMKSK